MIDDAEIRRMANEAFKTGVFCEDPFDAYFAGFKKCQEIYEEKLTEAAIDFTKWYLGVK